jgi:hypothetical protein
LRRRYLRFFSLLFCLRASIIIFATFCTGAARVCSALEQGRAYGHRSDDSQSIQLTACNCGMAIIVSMDSTEV